MGMPFVRYRGSLMTPTTPLLMIDLPVAIFYTDGRRAEARTPLSRFTGSVRKEQDHAVAVSRILKQGTGIHASA